MINLALLRQDDLVPRFYRMVVANILSNIMVPLAGLIGSAFLGHLTEIHHLAGVATATVLTTYIYRLLNFLRMGTTGVTAQAVGRGDRQALLMVGLRNGLVALGLGVALIALLYPLQELWFTLLEATPEIKASGQAYFFAQMWAAPAITLNLVLVGWLLGQEMSGRVLWSTAVGNVANVVLNYFYITQWGWGSQGAGLSACVSQYLMLFMGVIFVIQEVKPKEVQALAQEFWDLPAFKNVFALNADLFLGSLANRAVFILFTNVSATIGTIVLTGNALSLEIILLTLACVDGIGLATETISGNFKGKGETERMAPLLIIILGTSLVVGFSFALVSLLFPQTIFGLLTNHADVTAEVKTYIPWLLPVLGFYSTAVSIDAYFMGLGDGKPPRNSSLIAFSVGFVPVAVLARYTHSNHILWLSLCVFMLVRALLISGQVSKTLTSPVEG